MLLCTNRENKNYLKGSTKHQAKMLLKTLIVRFTTVKADEVSTCAPKCLLMIPYRKEIDLLSLARKRKLVHVFVISVWLKLYMIGYQSSPIYSICLLLAPTL